MLMNSGHTSLFHMGFCTVYLGAKDKIQVHYHRVHKGNMIFWGEIKDMSKTKKLPARKKIALELLHQRIGQRSTRSLFTGDTTNVW